jgi:hypothetical protein
LSVSVYTVANEAFFPGLVGLVTSLRVHGHSGPVIVGDSGLKPEQAEAISHEALIVPMPPDLPPPFAKPVAPLEHPDDVMIFLDADILCVRPLDPLIARARAGSILAVEDVGRVGLSHHMWRQWEDRLELGPLREASYINSGFFALPRENGMTFFTVLAECLGRVDPDETFVRPGLRADLSLPFFYADQDVANAVLASARFRERTEVLPHSAAPHPPFRGIKVSSGLSCFGEDGERPYFLHHVRQKPWSVPLPSNPYTELLVEFIHHPLAPRFDESQLPLFLRAGRTARTARHLRSARGHARTHVRGRLGLRPYLQSRVRRAT